MNNDPAISVVIPLYREGKHIRQSLEEIKKHLDSLGRDYEIVLVDDGSTDNTWAEVRELAQTIPQIRAFRLSRNFGKEAAMSAGIERTRGAAIIVMDSDLQHPPSLIPEMVRLWADEGAEVVDAVKASRGHESPARRIGASLFTVLMCKLTGFDFAGASDFKLIDHKVIDAWLDMKERLTFYRGMIAWLGFNHRTVPFQVTERAGGDSAWSLFRLERLAIMAITSFSSLPLRLVTWIGALFLVTALGLSCSTLYQWFMGEAVTGFPTVIILQLAIGSIIMISLGIIGEYIATIFHEVKRRPRFIIRDAIERAGGDD